MQDSDSEGHSRPGKVRQEYKSGHRKNARRRWALTDCRAQTETQVRTRREMRVSDGHSRSGELRQVSTRGECKSARGAHVLGSPERDTSQDTEQMRGAINASRDTHILGCQGGEASQDMEGMRTGEGHSQTGEPKPGDKLGQGKNVNQRWSLTNWRTQMKRQVRKQKTCEQVRSTHFL